MGIKAVRRSGDALDVDPTLDDMLAALMRLDRLLAEAAQIARTVYGREAATDPYRGLYISDEDVERLLERPPGAPVLHGTGRIYEEPFPTSGHPLSRLVRFRQAFGLTPFDMDLVLIALAPEIDLRYERLYAYLQDDVNRKRPTVELAFNLLCTSVQDKIQRRSHIHSNAPLIRQGILQLVADPHRPQPPLPAQFMRLDGQIVELLLAQEDMDARDRSHPILEGLTRRIRPRYAWCDIVLPEDILAQLEEICRAVAYRHRVLGEWGFDRKLSSGKGVSALFSGPPGTGKTMAAEVIAHELGLDLYKIDLSGVVSKYIGETEKNLARIFRAAESTNAILFFDEADALFGRRSEVQDSHDRYANIEISYLLQKMEEYDGVAVLATNLPQHLDAAFRRRLSFVVHFPFPDESSRRRIWTAIWPQECPLAREIDLDLLARRYKLSGGNIKNIALAAAFLAAGDGNRVGMPHLWQALRREYQKMGKPLTSEESGAGIPEAAS
jgi:hypothetical protein